MTLRHNLVRLFGVLTAFFLLLSACSPAATEIPPTPTETSLPQVTATPTPLPARSLTVCLGEEPNSLYPFGPLNSAARSVLSAIYDGPIDTVGYEYQPVILTQLPSLENKDAQIVKITVRPRTEIVDANGNLTTLQTGTRVRPSGCRSNDCVITYDGVSPLEMDQMVVTFRLRPDLTWSDGTPLTADDSVYAFTVAKNSPSSDTAYLAARTQSYEAADPTTVQWWGKPGFIDPTYFTNFWQPAPKHLWSKLNPADLPKSDLASRTPLGWGPYAIQEWVPADHITLSKNPYYFRTGEGLPKFDTLTFRFLADPNAALSELVAGRCDVLDPTVRLDGQAALLKQMQESGQIRALFATGMTIEWLGLGIAPASYDDGYDNQYAGDRQDFFADPRTRQAIALCLDRQKVVDTVLLGLTTVPNSYLPAEHPLFESGVATYPFDPTAAAALLDQAGWRDLDGNPATPRTATFAKNVTPGTRLILNYYTTTATQRRQAVEILSASLAQCGIGLNVQYFSQNDLYAPGPQGPLFGRHFDLAQYAMGVEGFEPPCTWFTSQEIPNKDNHWVGTNISGYRDKQFDQACETARSALPDETAYAESHRQAQKIFAEALPAIPLYFRLKVAVTRPDFCHFDLDPTANPLWNIEAFDYGAACQP